MNNRRASTLLSRFLVLGAVVIVTPFALGNVLEGPSAVYAEDRFE